MMKNIRYTGPQDLVIRGVGEWKSGDSKMLVDELADNLVRLNGFEEIKPKKKASTLKVEPAEAKKADAATKNTAK